MNVRKISKLTGLAILGVLVLAGCRAEEQGRLINYEPGVYKGKPDTELTEVQRRVLRQRSLHQGAGVASGGGAVPTKSRDVRKPSGSSIDQGKLRNRVKMQGGSSVRL